MQEIGDDGFGLDGYSHKTSEEVGGAGRQKVRAGSAGNLLKLGECPSVERVEFIVLGGIRQVEKSHEIIFVSRFPRTSFAIAICTPYFKGKDEGNQGTSRLRGVECPQECTKIIG